MGHALHPKEPKNAVRKWDGKTPYGVHPVWCAMTVLTEELLPESCRIRLSQALLFHDFREDTDDEVPDSVEDGVSALVDEMTFRSSDDEMENLWSRSDETKLGKLYDKTFNFLDNSWMSDERKAKHAAHLRRLCDVVQRLYGTLNIVLIARGVLHKLDVA
ncbi:MAG TPA: hypothetical protein PK539_00145 [Candidatus Paceibacterota bacterium]|nr:hypothetical protein [Candidatus Paceibacterota bacterium]